jgi:hypothetical protein
VPANVLLEERLPGHELKAEQRCQSRAAQIPLDRASGGRSAELDCRPISSGQGIEADQNQLSKSNTTRQAQLLIHPLEADGVKFYADAEEVLAKRPRRWIPMGPSRA